MQADWRLQSLKENRRMNDKSPLEIFWISGSPYSWRVLLALAVKQIPYESRLLSLATGENRSDEFLKVNPKGKVPALRHGAFTMRESVAIVRYLDRCFPTPPLFGANAAEEATINQQIDEVENYVVPNSHAITRAVFGNIVADREAVLNEQAQRIAVQFGDIEASAGAWLMGNNISAADIVLYPLVAVLLRAAGKPAARTLDLQLLPFRERYPKLSDWCRRVEALPGFDATYPPHWRDS